MDDRQLLRQYTHEHSHEAFGQLVGRHIGWVYCAALRQVGDPHLAEDVTQATFILLAQKARRISADARLSGWLFHTARFLARNALKAQARRQQHERRAATMASSILEPQAAEEAVWQQMAPRLDRAVARLGQVEQRAVILRFYQGKSLADVGSALGISEEAAKKRVARAVEKLRGILSPDTAALSTGTLTAVLATHTTKAAIVPAGLGGSAAAAAAGTAAIPSSAATLIQTATRLALWTKLTVAAVVVLAAGAGITATTLVALRSPRSVVPRETAVSPAGASASPATVPATAAATLPALTPEQAKETATRFVTALRDRNTQALADLLAGLSADERQATAARYIAELRDGPYARYPQRLDGVESSMFMSDRTGRLTDAVLSAKPPVLAEVRRLAVVLRPDGERWVVREAIFGDRPAALTPWTFAASQPTSQPDVPPGTYARAADAFNAFRDHLSSFDRRAGIPDQDKPKAMQSLKQAQDDLGRFADALKPTDLAIEGARVQRVSQAIQSLHDTLAQRGADAFFAEMAATADKPSPLMQDFSEIWAISNAVADRVDAEEEASHQEPHPPAFAASIELTLGWNGQKYQLQGPVKIPDWFRASRRFRTWQRQHDVRTFWARDDEGNRYEINCMGAGQYADGTVREFIPSVRQYRPDGTLAAAAGYDDHGRVNYWEVLDGTGQRYVRQVFVANDSGAEPYVRSISFFDAQNDNQRVWQIKPSGVVWLETLNDPIGRSIRTEHLVRDAPDTHPAAAPSHPPSGQGATSAPDGL